MEWAALLDGSKEAVRAIVTLILSGVSVLLGVFFIYSGISKMLAHARGERQGQPTAGPVAINLLIGALLVQLMWTTRTITQTLFGSAIEDPNAAMAYMPEPVQSNTMLHQAVNVGVLWIYCIGFIAIVRGFILWNAMANGAGRGQDNGWKGFWHIFFGALAINIPLVARMLTSGG